MVRAEWSVSEPSEEERLLLEAFIDAHERADAAAAAALARDDIRITMSPHPLCFEGLETIRPMLEEGLTGPGEWRLVPTRANRQPTAASYLRHPATPSSGPSSSTSCAAHRGRPHRRDHHLRRHPVPGVRPPADPLVRRLSR
jgi:hypothetical protein